MNGVDRSEQSSRVGTDARILALVNVALIPYVAIRFPHELRRYTHGCWRAIVHGERS